MPPAAKTRIVFLLTSMYSLAGEILRGIQTVARTHDGISVRVFSSLELGHRLQRLRGQADGIVALVTTPRLVGQLRELGLPTVNVSALLGSRAARFPRVYSDNLEIGMLAARDFWERGFRRFAFVGEQGVAFSQQRERGYRNALRARGVRPTVLHLRNPRAHTVAPLMRGWAQALTPRTAVFCAHDPLAAGLLGACDELGVPVPRHLAVLGVNNDPMICDLTPVPLSSIAHRSEQIGVKATLLLMRMLNGQRLPPGPVRIPPGGIVSRASTDTLAVEDPLVARILTFVQAHATAGIRVDDVVADAHVCRRLAEQRFRHATGTSVYQMIQRLRIQKAESLLLETHLSVGAVAEACGFSDLHHFVVSFRRLTGQTPRGFRRHSFALSDAMYSGPNRAV